MAAAYAALVSVMHIIHDVEHHPSPPISIDKQQVESLTEIVTFLQQFLEGYNSASGNNDEADPLEMRIAGAAYAAEDAIESHIVNMIKLRKSTCEGVDSESPTAFGGSNNWSSYFGCLTKPINHGRKINLIDNLYQDLQKVIKEMSLVKKEAMKITAQQTTVEAQLHRNDVVPASSVMVGFDDLSLEIMDKLTDGQLLCKVIPILGMGGTGKTTLAGHIYARPLTREHFDICGWATISQRYDTREIICELLCQVNKRSKQELSGMSEDELGLALHKHLFNRRFFIVLDDMWSVDAWNIIQRFLPDNENGSRVIVTTRESELSSQLNNNYCLKMKFLDKGCSWDLFTKCVFGVESCPLELEEIGKEIVENCRGLPLAIVVVGGLLKKMEHTTGCWECIRQKSSSVVNSANEDFCFKVLKMSYNHLPVHLKPCFLYMGVFEEDRAVRVSTLTKLWVSEGFLRPTSGTSLEATAEEYLHDLVHRNLIQVHELGSTGNIKLCKLHDLLRDLCWREAGKEGFYNVIGKQGLTRQHRVVVPRSTSKDEVDDALKSMPFARSFLCHSKEVRLLSKSKLVRTLKAYDGDTSGSHGYSFDHLFQYVNSRYLAAGVEYKHMSSFLYYLWNLQTLIILNSSWVYAPKEIWQMPQLRHIVFHKGGLYLPPPSSTNYVIMENLQTLKGVSVFVYEQAFTLLMPNIKKLGVSAGSGDSPINKSMTKLESYHCSDICGGIMSPFFPCSLKKMSLGSQSSHWKVKKEHLEAIGELPLLEKLKLERAEFPDKQWETSEEQFPSLKFLELKWCLLKYWTTDSSHFPRLEHLHLYALKELEEIPCEIGEISTLQSIHLEYCSESVVESAKNITEEQDEIQARVVLLNTCKNQALRSLASRDFVIEFVDF